MSENACKKKLVRAYTEQQEMQKTLKTDQKFVKEKKEGDEASIKKSADQNQNASSKLVGVTDSAGNKLLNTEDEKDNGDSLKLLAEVASSCAPQQGNHQKQKKPAQCASGRSKRQERPAPSTSHHQEQAKNPWPPVDIVTSTNCNIESYVATPTDTRKITTNNSPDGFKVPRVSSEPDTRYKARVAPVNSRGRGERSEPSVLKTAKPGPPDNPRNIIIARTTHGVKLSWDKPLSPNGKIKEYSVWLAVSSHGYKREQFNRVYCGPRATCFVPNSVLKLAAAIKSSSGEDETVFRVSAQNKKGYGSLTQFSWIHPTESNQDSNPKHGEPRK